MKINTGWFQGGYSRLLGQGDQFPEVNQWQPDRNFEQPDQAITLETGYTESGLARTSGRASGADQYIPASGTVYTEAGLARAIARASGSDQYIQLQTYTETGKAKAIMRASGAVEGDAPPAETGWLPEQLAVPIRPEKDDDEIAIAIAIEMLV